MEKEENAVPVQSESPRKNASLVVEYDPKVGFRTTLQGEIPVPPLVGVLVMQVVSLCMNQLAEAQRQQMTEAVRQGRVLMPDGSPFVH
jgi:hypothetical protein